MTAHDSELIAASLADPARFAAVFDRHYEEIWAYLGRRAGLYLVAARIPGIQVLGLTRDGIGRPALAVALNDTLYGERSELLFDPKTSALLGERTIVVKPPPKYHVKPGTISEGATYITSGIVERLGQVPSR